MKDHELAALVNDLTDIAREYGQSQQLRQRISLRVCAVPRDDLGSGGSQLLGLYVNNTEDIKDLLDRWAPDIEGNTVERVRRLLEVACTPPKTI